MPRVVAQPADRRRAGARLGPGLRPAQPAALVAAHDRVEDVRERRRRARAAGPQVLETERGAACAPTTAASARPHGERYAWEQEIEGTPFERILQARRGSRSGSSPRAAATEVTLTSERDAARALAARLADDARRRRAAASTRRSTGSSGRWSASRLSADAAARASTARSGGAGATPRSARRCPTRRAGDAARRARRRPSRPSGSSSTRSRCPRRARCPTRSPTRSTPASVLDRARGPRAPRGRHAAIPTWSGCARGALERGARRGGHARQTPSEVAAVLEACAARGRRGGPLRRRHQRRRRGRAARAASTSAVDRARPARGCARSRSTAISLTATLGPGLRGPEAEAALRAPRADARPLPAVVRVRDDRRLRRDPLGRPGLERLRALRRARHRASRWPPRPGELRTLATPAHGRRARRCASWSLGSEGDARRDHRGHGPGPPGARGAPLRGLDRPRLRLRARDRPRARPGAARCPTSPGSPTRRRPGSRSALSGAERARSGRCSTPTCGCAGGSGGCLVICGWEGERESVERRRALVGAAAARAAAPSALGAAAGPRLGARALRGPVPARRAARPRLLGRDARDLAHLVAARRALRGGRRRARRGAAAQGTPGIVMCHLSHAYRDGASLYFTFVARGRARRGDRAVARGQDRRLRGDRRHRRHDHPPPRGRPRPRPLHARPRWASSGIEALRALKERLDPAGIMNPGKLLPYG